MPGMQRTVVKVRGRVLSRRVQRGTASEHEGVVLETNEGEELRLVRLGGNPFSDPETRALVGRKVEFRGYRIGDELRFIDVVEAE